MKTTVLNLVGGASVGKSTTACGIYYKMKLMGIKVELVREYVKQWAWEGRKVGANEQLHITGKQSYLESLLYGKVEYIVTDSPLWLGPAYEFFYDGASTTIDAVHKFISKAEVLSGVSYVNFLLTRKKPFDPLGRFYGEKEARNFDDYLLTFLKNQGVNYTLIDIPDNERVDVILNHVLKNN